MGRIVDRDERSIQKLEASLKQGAEAIAEQQQIARDSFPSAEVKSLYVLKEIQEYLKASITSEMELLPEQVASLTGVDSAYQSLVRLEELIPEDRDVVYNKSLDIKPKYKEQAIEQYVSRLDAEQEKNAKKIDKVMEQFNALPLVSRKAIRIKNDGEMVVNLFRIRNSKYKY